MIKFLVIAGLISYVLYKIGSFFFRAGAAAQHFRQYQNNQKGNFEQKQQNPRRKPDSKVKGGEYIDFEEVK